MQTSKGKPDGFFSDDFKDLIQSLLQLSPHHRPTMSEVMAHPWMHKATPTHEEVTKEIAERMQLISNTVERDREALDTEKQERIDDVNRGPGGSTAAYKFNLRPETIKKQMGKSLDQYNPASRKHTEFFSSYDPEYLEAALIQYLSNSESIDPVVSGTKYKIKFTIVKKWAGAQSDMSSETEICVRILRVDGQMVCVEFQKVRGDHAHFMETF